MLRIQIRTTSLAQMQSLSRERHSRGSHRHVVPLPHSGFPGAVEGKTFRFFASEKLHEDTASDRRAEPLWRKPGMDASENSAGGL